MPAVDAAIRGRRTPLGSQQNLEFQQRCVNYECTVLSSARKYRRPASAVCNLPMPSIDIEPGEAVLVILMLQKMVIELEEQLRTRFDPFIDRPESEEREALQICERIEMAETLRRKLLNVPIDY